MLACDALLFSDVRGSEANSRRASIGERIHTIEMGQWGAIWIQLGGASSARATNVGSEMEQVAEKVRVQIEAGETSKAAGAA